MTSLRMKLCSLQGARLDFGYKFRQCVAPFCSGVDALHKEVITLYKKVAPFLLWGEASLKKGVPFCSGATTFCSEGVKMDKKGTPFLFWGEAFLKKGVAFFVN